MSKILLKSKKILFFATLTFFFQVHGQGEWKDLIDEELSQWELWMGVPHKTTSISGATSNDGITGTPLGLGNDPLNVFSVINIEGGLQLKITGEVYGGLTTLKSYADYHLSMEFKWGEKKYEPRLNRKRDSGILYHCQGEHGTFWNVWKSSLEFQVQETDCGDFIGLGDVNSEIQSQNDVFRPGGALRRVGFMKRSQDFERPNGEWNTLEIITIGDRSMHFVNGNLVNALENAQYKNARLANGQIQIQSEAAEIYYKNMRIRSVTGFPAAESALLGWSTTTPVPDATVPTGKTIRLQKSGGDQRYVSVTADNGVLVANTTDKNAAGIFLVEVHPMGGVALKDQNTGKYVQVQGNENTKPNRAFGNAPGTWEQFEWLAIGNGRVALKSVFTNTWVQASHVEDNAILYPLGNAAGPWEEFNFELVTDQTPNPIPNKGKVLIFYKTNGFNHEDAIAAGIEMIREQGMNNGLWDTDTTIDSKAFTTQNLQQYDVVIWCNTTGDRLLESDEQEAFETYIRNGGGFLGIHAATDTYRNREWPFYNELVGAIVQINPYHTANDYNATMTVNDTSHPAVDFLGATWNKTEEYYYWKNNGGQLYSGNINLLTVETTGPNDYDQERPVAWYKEYQGGRSFYTALGHNVSDYTDDIDFQKHIEEGIKWAGNFDGDGTLSTTPIAASAIKNIKVYPNPTQGVLVVENVSEKAVVKLSNLSGITVKIAQRRNGKTRILEVATVASGIYILSVDGISKRVVIE